jgi:hypothetical protein
MTHDSFQVAICDEIGALCVIIIVLSAYFLPIIIASRRDLAAGGPLIFVNLFFGWTLIGWFVCVLWAALGQTKSQVAFYEARGPR